MGVAGGTVCSGEGPLVGLAGVGEALPDGDDEHAPRSSTLPASAPNRIVAVMGGFICEAPRRRNGTVDTGVTLAAPHTVPRRSFMDEYQIEIRDLRRTLARLEADEAAPELIAEYEAEVRIHSALYRAAQETFAAGLDDTAMRDALASLGFGGWTLGNVYSFVYDASMELPDSGDL
ncbi:MAG TPA: hypothetical protein VFA70_14875, partial [Dehalococcoidia bacterium]|nr:hypothetical protein [Dehalococcoidia bacterium]